MNFLLNCKDRQGKEYNRCIFTWIYKTDSDHNLISASSRPKKYGSRGPNICKSAIACMWTLLGRIIKCSGETKWKSLYTKVTWSRISNPPPKVWPAKSRINQFFFEIPNTREVSHHVGKSRINKFGKANTIEKRCFVIQFNWAEIQVRNMLMHLEEDKDLGAQRHGELEGEKKLTI